MKSFINKRTLIAAILLAAGSAFGQAQIGRVFLGSGEPGKPGNEAATRIEGNVFHAPQYLPGSPTAGTIWPRVVEVPCTKAGNDLKCDGYHWLPEMGRGEYLFFAPLVQAPTPVVAPTVVTVPGPTQVIRVPVEVEKKRIRE
jgi:hypothetical protein